MSWIRSCATESVSATARLRSASLVKSGCLLESRPVTCYVVCLVGSFATSCVTTVCLWLDSEKLDEAWRPDRAKFLMYTEKDGQRLNVIVDPNQPGAWKREPYYRRLKAMSELALEGRELVVCIGDRRIVVFPHEDVDLGLVDPEHKLVSGYAERDGMMVPYAMILSDVDAG